jgi:hypothetical protein
MAGAYDLLVTMSEEQGSTLSHTAADVIRRVQQSR